jgi:hypothetical protein
MYGQTKNSTQHENITPSRTLSQNVRDGYVLPVQRRYPRTVVGVRAVVTVWLVFLGSVLMAHGYWAGSLLFVAAALHVALAYRLLATTRIHAR